MPNCINLSQKYLLLKLVCNSVTILTL